jgi:surface protein
MKKLLLLSALFIFTCTDDEGNPCVYEPTLTTEAATDITETSATLNGVISIVSENCDAPNNTEQGFVYSTEIQPTLADVQVNVNGTNISTTVEGLEPNTTYYVRAFLTNTIGDFYGEEVSFTTVEGCDVVYLDENGVTIKAYPCANIGDVGVVNGIEYHVVSQGSWNNLSYYLNNYPEIKLCTTRITNFGQLPFSYNEDISHWDVSNATSLGSMFMGNSSFNQDISNWDVSSVTNMNSMFRSCPSFNQDIGGWDTSSVSDMQYMFFESTFNQPIGNWDVSNVTTMNSMFRSSSFNQDIGDWDTSSVSDMQLLFRLSSFNQPIANWDVSNITSTNSMFSYSVFNQPIGNWDVSSVTDMGTMFFANYSFNQDIGNWDVSNVTNMIFMLKSVVSFNQDLSLWNVSNVTVCSGFSGDNPQWTLPQPNFTNCNPD